MKPDNIHPLKLTINTSIYDEPTEYDTPESQIKLLLDNPQYAFDRHQALLRTLGTSKNFKYMTNGYIMQFDTQITLTYEENMLLGMSGDPVVFHFPVSADRRGMLIIDRPTRGIRISVSDERCMANPVTVDKQPLVYTTLTHKLENTLTSNGGHLSVDFETSLYGMMLGRMSIEIKAVPTDYIETSELPEDTSLYLGRS